MFQFSLYITTVVILDDQAVDGQFPRTQNSKKDFGAEFSGPQNKNGQSPRPEIQKQDGVVGRQKTRPEIKNKMASLPFKK